jgi:hypothetical protein
MKKITKSTLADRFWEGEFKITVSQRLNKLKGKNLAPEKLAEANKDLHTMKGLPRA